MKKSGKFIAAALSASALLATGLAGCGSSSPASSGNTGSSSGSTSTAASFYKGKTIQFIIPHGVGGGFDLYSRLLAKYMMKYMPGTTIVPVNKTGAGGLLGTQLIYNAKPDGLTIGIFDTPGLIINQIIPGSKVKYNLTKASWIGRITSDTSVIAVSSKSGIKNFTDLRKASASVTFGVSGAGSTDDINLSLLHTLLGMPVKVVTGFSGTSAINQAVLAGTVTGTSSSQGSIQSELTAGTLQPLVVFGPDPHPTLPNVPTISQADTFASATAQKDLATLADIEGLDRTIAGPPGIPADRLTYLRTAMQKAMNDAQFQATLNKEKREFKYLSGSQVATDVAKDIQDVQPLVPVLEKLPGLGK